ncbi:hypothetical protein HYPSUDRAFT_198877 [Hypholoma sublateritium FD-334 SS-4]|uniref:MYND-type domain-containing protein n=1 Tax=Hypholoma sublateritium (strain FD-334 SS-4) TaxID=945553 RepID=A0A0D2LG72_HYPSF|nr:hypothetical protein HYPSUDRAFT_198877 [Hypholoma sublateritium FD-334 SS-4]
MPASDIVETSVVGDVTVVTTVAQDARVASWTGDIIPTKAMKAYRELLTTACSFCHKSQRSKLVCANCKVAAYCSKECQKKQWPSHKLVCQQSTAAAKLKLVTTLTANHDAEFTLMYAFVLAFDLQKNMVLDRPLVACCDLAVDAADLAIIFRLTSGEETPEDYPDGVEGMLQVKHFIPLDSNVAIDVGRRKIWEQARLKNHIKQCGPIGEYPAGLIDFHMEGTDQVVTIPLNIYDEAMMFSLVVANGAYVEVPDGKEIHMPFTPRAPIMVINMRIRDDKKNQLRLRTHMPKEALYKYVGSNINQQHLKMLPTTIYAMRNGKMINTPVRMEYSVV